MTSIPIKLLPLLFATTLFTGCDTEPKYVEETKNVSASITEKKSVALPEDTKITSPNEMKVQPDEINQEKKDSKDLLLSFPKNKAEKDDDCPGPGCPAGRTTSEIESSLVTPPVK